MSAKQASKGLKRVEASVADQWFPNRHTVWPRGYLPTLGVAHFLRSDGVAFRDIVETRMELQSDESNMIQRDFASDYGLWLKSELHGLMYRAKTDVQFGRALKRSTNRERLPSLASECALWNLVDPASVELDPCSTRVDGPVGGAHKVPNALPKTEVVSSSGPYAFRSYASNQEYSVLPIRDAVSPSSIITFATFPQLRNCLYTDFDSCSALKALSLVTSDRLVYTQEFIITLATYLRSRLDALGDAAIEGVNADGTTRYRPILSTFGNGRLAWFLNESRILPSAVIATQPERPLMKRVLHFKFDDESVVSPSVRMQFPCESIDVGPALEKYKPAVILAEPHVDRDFTAELRGFFTVRELLMLGQPDSPAMGSFTFPLLSWGVTPGPSTYWVFNNSMQRASIRGNQNLPMDPPYVAQGYKRYFIDDVSKCMLHPNDTAGMQNQSRCVSFRRELYCPPKPSSAGRTP